MHGRGVCGGGCAWQGGVHDSGGHAWQAGMHGRGCVWQGTCMVGSMHGGGCAW